MGEAAIAGSARDTFSTGDLSLAVDGEGVARLTLDRRDSRVNLVTGSLFEQLREVLDIVERGATAGDMRALVLFSAKRNSFVAGADLEELRSLPDAAAAADLSRAGQIVLRRLEMLPIPTIAAIHGVCLGSGAGLVLACAYRLASDSVHTQIGFPEIRLGLMPGIGGAVRLPRLIGLEASLNLFLTGRTMHAAGAAELGLVDIVVPTESFESEVMSFVAQRLARGRARTGARRNVARRMLEDTAPGRSVTFRRARKQLLPKAPGSPQIAWLVLQAIAETIALPLDRAFEREAEAFGQLAGSEGARSLLHSYRALQRARRSPAIATAQVEHTAVVGAGTGGSTAAYLLASAGISVRLKDVSRDTVLRGVHRSVSLFAAARGRARPTARELDRLGDLITTTTGFGGFGTVDAAIVAVGGRLEPSMIAAREAEDHTRDSCSLLLLDPEFRIEEAQKALLRPERVLGIHLARPVDGYLLAELASGAGTSPDAASAARILLRRLGRTPVEVADDPATPLRRMLGIYFAEAIRLATAGARPGAVDGALQEQGYLEGPFTRMLAYGEERAWRLLEWLEHAAGERMRVERIRAPASEEAPPQHRWEALRAASHTMDPPSDGQEPVTADAIRRRIHILLINEAANILQLGLIPTAERLDVISILGLGFPRAEGGLLYQADRIGLPRLVAELEEHASKLGPRFEPAPYLLRLASSGTAFYSETFAAGQHPGSVL